MTSKSMLSQLFQRTVAGAVMMAAVYFLSHTIAWANGGDAWRLIEVAGTVRVQQGEAPWQAAASGMTIREGDGLETGADGRAVLKSGADSVTVSPDSKFVVPGQPTNRLGANIVQKLGTLLFKIERTPDRRFAVDTPHLAAVVKGTVFTVTVRPDGGALQVTEGAVQVASLASGEIALVRPGQIAQIPSGPVGRMIILDRGQTFRAPPPTDGKATRMAAAPAKDAKAPRGRVVALAINTVIGAKKLDVAKATNGLVAPAAAPNASAAKDKGRGQARVAATDAGNPAETGSDSSSPAKGNDDTTGSLVATVATAIAGAVMEDVKSDKTKGGNESLGTVVGTAVSVTTDVVSSGTTASAAPAASTTTSVAAPVASTVTTAVAPVSSAVTPVAAPVASTVATVVAPVVSAIEPVVVGLPVPIIGGSSNGNGSSNNSLGKALGLLK
jgi:hypothetical protein